MDDWLAVSFVKSENRERERVTNNGAEEKKERRGVGEGYIAAPVDGLRHCVSPREQSLR